MQKTKISGLYLSFLKVIEDKPNTSIQDISKILKRDELTIEADQRVVRSLLQRGHILLNKEKQCFITPMGQSFLAKTVSDNEFLKANVRSLPGNCQECGTFDYMLTYFRKQFICANCLNADEPDSECCANRSWRASSPISAFPTDF